jgi:hypothetical protein
MVTVATSVTTATESLLSLIVRVVRQFHGTWDTSKIESFKMMQPTLACLVKSSKKALVTQNTPKTFLSHNSKSWNRCLIRDWRFKIPINSKFLSFFRNSFHTRYRRGYFWSSHSSRWTMIPPTSMARPRSYSTLPTYRLLTYQQLLAPTSYRPIK